MKFLPSRQPTRDVSPRPSGYPDKASKGACRCRAYAANERPSGRRPAVALARGWPRTPAARRDGTRGRRAPTRGRGTRSDAGSRLRDRQSAPRSRSSTSTAAAPVASARRAARSHRHFVSSMSAPVASGWSGRRMGLAPTGKASPCHGARGKPTFLAPAGLMFKLDYDRR
jgi:hypothetical protein